MYSSEELLINVIRAETSHTPCPLQLQSFLVTHGRSPQHCAALGVKLALKWSETLQILTKLLKPFKVLDQSYMTVTLY